MAENEATLNFVPKRNLFKKDDIVWAKVRGYPWWPATFLEYYEDDDPPVFQAVVNFIGSKSHAYLDLSKVAPYAEFHKIYSNTKRKDLLDSIKEADNIFIKKGGSLNESDDSPIHNKKLEEENKHIKIKTLDQALVILDEINANFKENVKNEKIIIEVFEKIASEIKDHNAILKTRVGINITRFLKKYYESNMINSDIVISAKKCLQKFEKIIFRTYFGEDIPSEISIFEKFKFRQIPRKLRKTVEEEEENIIPISTAISEEKNGRLSSPLQNIEKMRSEPEEAKIPEKSKALMISICQEMAKLIEDVFLR